MYDHRRAVHKEREDVRWGKIRGAEDQKEAYYEHNRANALGARSNIPSEHFNILNLDYHPTYEGQMLKYKVLHDSAMAMPWKHSQCQPAAVSSIQPTTFKVILQLTAKHLCAGLKRLRVDSS